MAYSSDQIASHKATICDRIANGESLRQICGSEDMPACSTVFLWLNEDATFSEQYARAREAQADALFDEILIIADTPMLGEKRKIDKDGNEEITTGDMIEHRRLQVDARKWMAGKLKPKKYGDKIELGHTGEVGVVTKVVFEIEDDADAAHS